MKWITKPNKIYDRIKEPYRLIFLIFLILICFGIETIFNKRNITNLFLAIIGLYRILYFMIGDYYR